MRLTWMIGLLLAFSGSASTVLAEDWVSYENERYGTVLKVPSSMVAQPPPRDETGLTWVSQDGQTELVLYGSDWSERSESFDAYRQWFKQMMADRGAILTSETEEDDWFSYEGSFKGFVFFVRTNRSTRCPNLAHTIELAYPAAQKAERAPWASRLGRFLSESPSSAECP